MDNLDVKISDNIKISLRAQALYAEHPTYKGNSPLSWYDAPLHVKREFVQKAITEFAGFEVTMKQWIDGQSQQSLPCAFDEAVAEELKKVTAIPSNSHDVCQHFANNLRERLFPRMQAPKKLTAEQLLHLKDIHVGPADASDTKYPLTDADWVAFGMAVQDAQANL